MRRLFPLFLICIGLLAGSLATALVLRPSGLDEAQVRAIVADEITSRPAVAPQSVAAIDPKTLDPMIESYLMDNPKILQKVSAALKDQLKAEQDAATTKVLAELHPEIYDDPGQVVLGNPKGDVTLVEMFDYNCTFCRQALPDLASLLDDDPKLRVILKEFPILSQGSADAARVAVLVNQSKPDQYWQFHQELFTSRGQVTKETALKAASELGLNPIQLELKMNEPAVTAVIDKSYDIADKLKVSGTPTYIIGNEVIPGAVDLDQLKSRIANMRACGQTECPAPQTPVNSG